MRMGHRVRTVGIAVFDCGDEVAMLVVQNRSLVLAFTKLDMDMKKTPSLRQQLPVVSDDVRVLTRHCDGKVEIIVGLQDLQRIALGGGIIVGLCQSPQMLDIRYRTVARSKPSSVTLLQIECFDKGCKVGDIDRCNDHRSVGSSFN